MVGSVGGRAARIAWAKLSIVVSALRFNRGKGSSAGSETEGVELTGAGCHAGSRGGKSDDGADVLCRCVFW